MKTLNCSASLAILTFSKARLINFIFKDTDWLFSIYCYSVANEAINPDVIKGILLYRTMESISL